MYVQPGTEGLGPPQGERPDGRGLRIGVAVARFNPGVTERLLEGCLEELEACGVVPTDIPVVRVPGAFELPLAALILIRRYRVDAVVCLGAVIRGETPHFEYVSAQAAAGIMQAGLLTGTPVIFGVLTTDTPEQTYARAGGAQGHKGKEAARVAVEMARLARGEARPWLPEEGCAAAAD